MLQVELMPDRQSDMSICDLRQAGNPTSLREKQFDCHDLPGFSSSQIDVPSRQFMLEITVGVARPAIFLTGGAKPRCWLIAGQAGSETQLAKPE